MFYENMPLYPGMKPAGSPDGCMKVRLFDDGCGSPHCPPAMYECERVTIENPCRRGERAEVVLGIDDCGNLVICVHRTHREPCGMREHRDCWQPRGRCLPQNPCAPKTACLMPKPCRPGDRPGGHDRCRIPCRKPARGCGPIWD